MPNTMFTREAADVAPSTGGSVAAPANYGALTDLLRGVGNEYANIKDASNKAAAKQANARFLADTADELSSINEAVFTGQENPIFNKALEDASNAERAAIQLSSRKSDVAAILGSVRARQRYREAADVGDIALMGEVETLFSKYSTVDSLGGVIPELVERGELNQERLQQQLLQDLQKMAIENGMLSAWATGSPEQKAEMVSGWEKETQAKLRLEEIVRNVNAQSATLGLTQKQMEVRNQQMVTPQIAGLREQALGVLKDAIILGQGMDVTKTTFTDPAGNQVDAATYRANNMAVFKARLGGLRNALAGTKLPGIESVSEASIQYLNNIEADVMDALQGKDQADALNMLYNAVDKKDTLNLPDELRKTKPLLPYINTMAQLDKAYGTKESSAQLVSSITAIGDLVQRNLPSMVSLGTLPEQQQKESLKITNVLAKNLLGKYGQEENQASVNAVVGHIIASNNQFALAGGETQHWYGDFLAELLSNKSVYDELSQQTTMTSQRNKAALNNSLLTYKAQLDTAIAQELRGTIRPLNKTYKLKEVIVATPTNDGIVFSASPDVKPSDLPAVKQAVDYLRVKYGMRYRNAVTALENVVGTSPEQPEQEQKKTTNSGVEAKKQKAMQMLNNLSEEELDLLIQSNE